MSSPDPDPGPPACPSLHSPHPPPPPHPSTDRCVPRGGAALLALLTSVQALEGLIGEEAQAGVGNDPQHGRNKSVVEGLQPLFSRDADEDVEDVAVPVGQSSAGGGVGGCRPQLTNALSSPSAGAGLDVDRTPMQKFWHLRGPCMPKATFTTGLFAVLSPWLSTQMHFKHMCFRLNTETLGFMEAHCHPS